MEDLIVGGYDSAWGARNLGALAYLKVGRHQDGNPAYELAGPPTRVTWPDAATNVIKTNPRALAIDQPLVVTNSTQCRPVERLLASQLGNAHCGAYPANTSIPVFSANARIWAFLAALDAAGFSHDPCGAKQGASSALTGHRYFECYPHLAILGLSGLPRILKYKVRHHNTVDWQSLLTLIARFVTGFNPASFAAHTKADEDKVDAVVCALVAAHWLADAGSSEIIGSLSTGYMVSPLSVLTRQALAQSVVTCPASVQLAVNDHGVLWASQNPWMTSVSGFAQLRVILVDEDGAPEFVFVPFAGQAGPGVKIDDSDPANKAYWTTLSAGASNANILQFAATYRYVP